MGRAFDNTSVIGSGAAPDIGRMQLHKYWRGIHVYRGKLLHGYATNVERILVLVLSRKIQLETDDLIIKLDKASRRRLFQVECENLHTLLVSLEQQDLRLHQGLCDTSNSRRGDVKNPGEPCLVEHLLSVLKQMLN